MKKLTNKILLSVAAAIIITQVVSLSIWIYRNNHMPLKGEYNEIRNVSISVNEKSVDSIAINADTLVIK